MVYRDRIGDAFGTSLTRNAGLYAPDIASIAARVGEGRLSFASAERLAAHLGLTPGAVSPFGLLNDRSVSVVVLLDTALRAAERVGFHPNVNTATVVLTFADFERFLAARGNPVTFI